MEYIDEQILRLRNQNRKIDNLENGVYIKGELVEFEPYKLFKDKMEIVLPKTFIDMPSNIAKIKYPSHQRPQIIKTDLSGATNFSFNLFNNPIDKNELDNIINMFKTTIKSVNPANVFYDSGTENIGDTKLSWFDFKGYAIDSQIYYIYYITTIGGNLLHGIFNCLISDIEIYKDIAFMVMRSIKDLSGGIE